MYKVMKDGSLFAMIGTPVWVLKQSNGSFGLCSEKEAEGMVIEGTVYHVDGFPEIEGAETVSVVRVDSGIYASNLIALLQNPDDLENAEQFRKAVQMLAATLTEEQALVIPLVYPEWATDQAYTAEDIVAYGENSVGDAQLYKVVQAHTSQADWTPDETPALYDAFGLDDEGYPIWSQPTGAHDAYSTGDIVDYNGTLYISLIDGNVWAPDVYPAGWEIYTES